MRSPGLTCAAPEITGISDWINSPPLKIAGILRGKVVLVDFWTYSCINCVRTLPYITQWDTKYRKDGLVIIGVHAPEFEFEKKLDNVKTAVEKYSGIHYPVALDSDLRTWSAFNNRGIGPRIISSINPAMSSTPISARVITTSPKTTSARYWVSGSKASNEAAARLAASKRQRPISATRRAKRFASEGDVKEDEMAHYTLPCQSCA